MTITLRNLWGGGVPGKALTMTPWNLTHGQWSKNWTMATDILESAPWSMVKLDLLRSNFVVKSKVYLLTMEIRISAMVMVKMGIFVVKFHDKIGKISGWPLRPWKIWILAVVMVEILTI